MGRRNGSVDRVRDDLQGQNALGHGDRLHRPHRKQGRCASAHHHGSVHSHIQGATHDRHHHDLIHIHDHIRSAVELVYGNALDESGSKTQCLDRSAMWFERLAVAWAEVAASWVLVHSTTFPAGITNGAVAGTIVEAGKDKANMLVLKLGKRAPSSNLIVANT